VKKEMAGVYSHFYTKSEDGYVITVEGRSSFLLGLYGDESEITLTQFMDGKKYMFKYKFSISGKYRIQDAYLVIDYNVNTFKLEPVQTQSDANANMKDYVFTNLYSSLKAEAMEESRESITELDKKRLVVVSKEGTSTTYKRVSTLDLLAEAVTTATRKECEINNTGTITLINNAAVPFIVYINGVNKGVIQGNSTASVTAAVGTHSVKVVEQSPRTPYPKTAAFDPFVVSQCGERTCTWN
jgi:hypothetical protein